MTPKHLAWQQPSEDPRPKSPWPRTEEEWETWIKDAIALRALVSNMPPSIVEVGR